MAQTATARIMTADELLRLRTGHAARHELIEGELREMEPAGADHGGVAARICALLERHVSERDLGRVFAAETGFWLARDPDTVRAPDVAFVTAERAKRAGRVEGYWPGPPDLAVEVVSPSDPFTEVHEKALAWLRAGAQLVLVVDPATRRVTAYRSLSDVAVLEDEALADCDDVVPGFAPQVGALFP